MFFPPPSRLVLYLKIKQNTNHFAKSRHPTCANWFLCSSNLTSFSNPRTSSTQSFSHSEISMKFGWDKTQSSPYVLLGLFSSKGCISTTSAIMFFWCFFPKCADHIISTGCRMSKLVSNFECLFRYFFQLTLKSNLKEVQFTQNYLMS